jgi:hypothetical protein
MGSMMASPSGCGIEPGEAKDDRVERYIFLPSSAHVTVPVCHLHHAQAVQDFGKCCRWNRGRCIWDMAMKRIGNKYTRRTDTPLVVQRAVRYPELAKQRPDICVSPIDDWVYAHKRWPVRIGPHAEVQCRWHPQVRRLEDKEVEGAPPCGSVRRVPIRMASTVGKRARYNSKASRMLLAPFADMSP